MNFSDEILRNNSNYCNGIGNYDMKLVVNDWTYNRTINPILRLPFKRNHQEYFEFAPQISQLKVHSANAVTIAS